MLILIILKHYLICNILHNNNQNNETIDINNMSIIVRKISKRQQRTAKKIKLLETKINNKKSKFNKIFK